MKQFLSTSDAEDYISYEANADILSNPCDCLIVVVAMLAGDLKSQLLVKSFGHF